MRSDNNKAALTVRNLWDHLVELSMDILDDSINLFMIIETSLVNI